MSPATRRFESPAIGRRPSWYVDSSGAISSSLAAAAAEREACASEIFFSLCDAGDDWLCRALEQVLEQSCEDGCTITEVDGAPNSVGKFLQFEHYKEPKTFDEFVELHNRLLDWYTTPGSPVRPSADEVLAHIERRSFVQGRRRSSSARGGDDVDGEPESLITRSSRAANYYDELSKDRRVRVSTSVSEMHEYEYDSSARSRSESGVGRVMESPEVARSVVKDLKEMHQRFSEVRSHARPGPACVLPAYDRTGAARLSCGGALKSVGVGPR